jgi:hypothetical protein
MASKNSLTLSSLIVIEFLEKRVFYKDETIFFSIYKLLLSDKRRTIAFRTKNQELKFDSNLVINLYILK